MGEVGIHLDHDIGSEVKRSGKARSVGGPQALLAIAMQYVNAILSLGELVGDLTCPVGRAVIDDQNLKPTRLLLESACERFLKELEAIVGSEENSEPAHVFPARVFFPEAPGSS